MDLISADYVTVESVYQVAVSLGSATAVYITIPVGMYTAFYLIGAIIDRFTA